MSNQRTEGNELRAALASELERRRGHAPEPGEIFVLTETAELPVEWALLEVRPQAFLAVPADVQPLAGSRDLALGTDVLSGPLVLRCGHAVPIAATRLRPELRTGLLDPPTLAAARALQAAVAAGTAAVDPLGEEVDRDPEYRDWVEEVLDPARVVMAGFVGEGEKEVARGGAVVEMGDWRERRREKAERSEGSGFRGWVRRGSPWLAAALLAVAVGLGWQLANRRQAIVFEPQAEVVPLGSVVRGDVVIKLAPDQPWLLLEISLSTDVPSVEHSRVRLVRADGKVVLEEEPSKTGAGVVVPILITRSLIAPGRYRLELVAEGGNRLAEEEIRIELP